MIPADEMRQNTREAVDNSLAAFEKTHVGVLSKLEKLMAERADKGRFELVINLYDADADILKLLSDQTLVSHLRLLLGINGYRLKYFSSLKRVHIDWYPDDVRAEIEERKERLRNL